MTGSTVEKPLTDSGVPTAEEVAAISSTLAIETAACAMNGKTLRRAVTIRNPHGFHVRPAAAFAEAAGKYDCEVTLSKGDQRVDGRRVLELIMLAAEVGTQLVLEVSGPEAAEAIEVLAAVVESPEPPPPPLPKKG